MPSVSGHLRVEMKPLKIDVDLLKQYISYDSFTGQLRWAKKPCSRIVVGSLVGCKKSKDRPYIVFRLMGCNYLGHRVAWAIHSGSDVPDGYEIDHINGKHDDNRIDNLRLALPSQNKSNSVHLPGVSGFRGVIWDKMKGKWRAQISYKNKCIWLGNFDSVGDAADARINAEIRFQGEYSLKNSRGI